MTPLLAAAGVVVALGAALAIGARGGRTAAFGVLVALVFSPFVADPLPAVLPAAFRIVAGVLAAFLLVIASRRAGPADRGPLGLPAALLAAAAAGATAFGATAVGLPAFGTAAALGAGSALLVLAAGPIVLARDGFRLGVAAVIMVDAGLLLRTALAGTPPTLETVVGSVALVAVAAAALALAGAAAAASGERPHAPPGGVDPGDGPPGTVAGRLAATPPARPRDEAAPPGIRP